MTNSRQVLIKRLDTLQKHFEAILSFKVLIDKLARQKAVYTPEVYTSLEPQEKAIFEAYLKRFASIQDYLGTKVFPLLLEVAGIGSQSMSQVLAEIEKEGIIDKLETWITLREKRNELEHEYPDDMQTALEDLRFCVESMSVLEGYHERVRRFAARFLA